MLTPNEIERTMYTFVKASDLGKAIGGDVYRRYKRPSGSTAEDIVLWHSAGLADQIQTGIVRLNIYTLPKVLNRTNTPDEARCGALERLFYDMLETGAAQTGVAMRTDGSPRVDYDPDTKQFVIACRIRYQYLNLDY